MKRREFIGLVGVAAASWPLAARAQQQGKLPIVGVLVLGDPDPGPFMAAFRAGLRNAGYVEGQDIRLEFRSAGGKAAGLAKLAAELVDLHVDVITAWQTPPALAAKQATGDIPIVMAGVADPIGTGLVRSLAQPGGNVTGNTALLADIVTKVVELVRETLPSARRVAVLANAADPFTPQFLAQIEGAAQRLGIAVDRFVVHPSDRFDGPFEAMRQKQASAVIVQPSLLNPTVAGLALKHGLPSFSTFRQLPATGGLMSYGAISSDQWRDAAVYVGKILKGARPADLPVAQPTRFALVVNLKTARALDLTLPPTLLARADEVIE